MDTGADEGTEQPTSGEPTEEPQSGRAGSRPTSGQQRSRPPSGQQRSRPTSGRPGSRPTSGRPASRPTSGQPESGALVPTTEEEVDQDFQATHARVSDILGRPLTEPTDLQDSDLSDGGELVPDDGGEVESDEGSDSETDVVVLDPDHPLMKRFQAALKSHLNKQHEKISLELRELDESLKTRKRERENLGVELYGVQQELARYQMMLEQNHDSYANVHQSRLQEEQELTDVRHLYKDTQLTANKEKKKGVELQAEVENLSLRIYYMDNAKEDVRGDIAVMRRAAEKVESEVTKAEVEKQMQDLYVDRLVERVDRLKEEIAMFEAQITAQAEETKVARDALMEANMEIEAIGLEKKQLFQQWSSSLIGMRRRDEAHSAMQEALSEQQRLILSLQTEIEGYKKSINKEQEQNERLCLILSKTERDIETVKKQLTQCQAKHDALKSEYTTFSRMMYETEQALSRATADKTMRLGEVENLRKQIERESQEKMKLEDEIMECIRGQLTLEKASQYTKKLTSKLRAHTRNLETQMAEVENKIACDALEGSNVKARIERLKKIARDLDNEIATKNDIVNRSEQEILKRNVIIERKQNVIDQYNKKLEQMIHAAGGIELGPLEITINSLQKSIDVRIQETAELQQMWLRQQSELVRLVRDKDDQSQDVEKLKKQLTILAQKKIRTENNIDQQGQETYRIEKHISNMQTDMVKLNTLLHREKGYEMSLEQNNILMENDFIAGLKEAEYESIDTQARLDGVKEEKERLLNSLVEAERQIMLWEKKTQLARETRAAVDSEVGQGEVRAMKSEIHRMQVRYTQLMKQQEKMIQEMEKAVSRRDSIVTRGEAQSKMKVKVLTKGTFERQMAELRKKIKQTINDANSCDQEIKELRDHQGELSESLEQKQINCQHLQGSADTLDGDINRLVELKQKNLSDLLSRQQKMKYYIQVKDGKYTMLCKTDTSLDTEYSKQIDRMQTLSTIVDRLNQEFPHAQPALRRVTMALASHSVTADDQT
ncbi:coiled-coil domain-containing protein 40-like [Gigantopelta aegis]|uniref:coiled-coil domain-containing protein 40-like n=1 Tax=Gigantopelta aegis TaxID=1735272 RepID=UPI001B8893F6|nr:coiled-coil domain-containing protein 40-like [Gigantopelta aegis]